MTAKHTPGPWYANRNHCYWEINTQESEYSPSIAECCPSACNWGEDIAAANARLIAAAPDLLAALLRLVDCPDMRMDSLELETIEALRQADLAINQAVIHP